MTTMKELQLRMRVVSKDLQEVKEHLKELDNSIYRITTQLAEQRQNNDVLEES